MKFSGFVSGHGCVQHTAHVFKTLLLLMFLSGIRIIVAIIYLGMSSVSLLNIRLPNQTCEVRITALFHT